MKLIISDVDLGEGKSFVVSREFLKRLQEYIENGIPLPEPRCITQRAADGAFTSAQILKVLDVSKEQRKRSLKRTPRP